MIERAAAALLFAIPLAVAADNDSADAPPDPSWKATFEDQIAHDSNPQLGLKRYAPANQFAPDWFNYARASGSFEDPSIPLRVRARALNEAYFHEHQVDTSIVRGAVAAPLALDAQDEVAPEYSREDQWYDGHYFQATSAGSVDWTRSWSPRVESELRPYYGELTHPSAYRGQDGFEYGVETTVSLLAPEGRWLREIDLGATPDRYEASRAFFGYHQIEVFTDLDWALPFQARLLVDASLTPTTYNAPEPGKSEVRHDRTVALDVNLSRQLVGPIRAEAICELTRDRSSLRAYSYDEAIIGAGLKAIFP
jgi:hypothetical protein